MYGADVPSYAGNQRLPAGVEIYADEQENLQQGVPRQAVLLQQWLKVHGDFRTPKQVDGRPERGETSVSPGSGSECAGSIAPRSPHEKVGLLRHFTQHVYVISHNTSTSFAQHVYVILN